MSDPRALLTTDYLDIGNPLAFLGHKRIGFHGFALVQNNTIVKRAVLPVAPQSFEQDEEAAVVLTPTQGGMLRERRGNIFKDIVISGTTGFSPPTRAPSVPLINPSSSTGGGGLASAIMSSASTVVAAIQSITGINPGDAIPQGSADPTRTGYAYFLYLRALFREYWAIHRNGAADVRRTTDFLYYNPAEDEFWLVEPLRFRMSRDRSSPMLRRYTIILKTISQSYIKRDEDWLIRSGKAGGLMGVIELVRDVAKTVTQVIDSLTAVLNTLVTSVKGLVDTVLGIASTVLNSINKLIEGVKSVLDLPENLLKRLRSFVEEIYQTADAAGFDLRPETNEALVDLSIAMAKLISRPELFTKQWSEQYSASVANFQQTWGTGSESFDFGVLKDVREGRVLPNETIYELSVRLLGNADYAQSIILLNSLKAPYFSPSANERLSGTLAPGDVILLPVFDPLSPRYSRSASKTAAVTDPTATVLAQFGSGMAVTVNGVRWRKNQWAGFSYRVLSGRGAGQTGVIAANTSNALTLSHGLDTTLDVTSVINLYFERYAVSSSQTGFEDQLGEDIKLGSDDDALFGSGDVATVAGMDNMAQAILIKTKVYQHELPANPWFGMTEEAGRRLTPATVFEARYNTIQTVLSDPRVENMSHLTLQASGDKLQLVGKIKIRNGGLQPIEVGF